jgi:hypothetical protein
VTCPIVPIPLRAIRIMGWVLRQREEARRLDQCGYHATARRKRYAARLDERVAGEVIRKSLDIDEPKA